MCLRTVYEFGCILGKLITFYIFFCFIYAKRSYAFTRWIFYTELQSENKLQIYSPLKQETVSSAVVPTDTLWRTFHNFSYCKVDFAINLCPVSPTPASTWLSPHRGLHCHYSRCSAVPIAASCLWTHSYPQHVQTLAHLLQKCLLQARICHMFFWTNLSPLSWNAPPSSVPS